MNFFRPPLFSKKLFALLGLTLLLASCATETVRPVRTIAQLKDVKPDLNDVKIEGGLEKAMQKYQRHLENMPQFNMTPEFIRRLADIKIKKEFDLLESGASAETKSSLALKALQGGAGAGAQSANMREAIALYRKLISDYPDYAHNDQVLYQLAHVYEELGEVEESMNMMNRLANDYPGSHYLEEIQFRRGEYFFARKKLSDAKGSYQAVIDIGARSPYFEFSLSKLGWTYYKMEMYDEAVQQSVTLLEHKISKGYVLERPKDSLDEKQIEDTYRVISLSFANLGGAEAIVSYFNKHGKRTYENSIYKNLGDFYLDKRRYSDAVATFKAFVKRYPYHKLSPYFEMWAIDSGKKGGFPTLVIESNKEFVAHYGLKSAYWTRNNIAAYKDVSSNVKASIKELANYYHAQYQDKRYVKNKDENFNEAVKWYRQLLELYPNEQSVPAIRYQLAELLHENKLFDQAAIEYEHIAYNYPAYEKAAAAGYAAIVALRESVAMVAQGERERVKRDIIRSSNKFAETFPKSEKAALVSSAAIDDIYKMNEHTQAAAAARKLLASNPTEQPIQRASWLIIAHSSFELGNFKDAEEAYMTVLGLTTRNDSSRADLLENLAASIYKQGEKANKQGDYKLAAMHFLKVGTSAPTATIRPVADYDGATALMLVKDWDAAKGVLRSFRGNYPGHELQPEVTKKIAFIYKETGELSLAAAEYERIGADTQDVAVRRATFELAADMYLQEKDEDKAYLVYRRYVNNYPKPIEDMLEMRNKIAIYLKKRGDMKSYYSELKQIMAANDSAGSERTDRTHYLGATAALALAEQTISPFTEIKLVKPFAKNLLKKKDAMKTAKEQLEKLFDYEVGDVTSAATYYLADMYYNFSRALVESERPDGMNDLEKEQYELSIEEQAFPFEEKAIQVHQKNLELITRGVYNSWIDMSIEKLAKLVPARYAKFEESSGYLEAVDADSYSSLAGPKRVAAEPSPVPVPVAAPPAAGNVPAQEVSPPQNKVIQSTQAIPPATVK